MSWLGLPRSGCESALRPGGGWAGCWLQLQYPYVLGLGIDEDTAIIISPDGIFEVIGSQTLLLSMENKFRKQMFLQLVLMILWL